MITCSNKIIETCSTMNSEEGNLHKSLTISLVLNLSNSLSIFIKIINITSLKTYSNKLSTPNPKIVIVSVLLKPTQKIIIIFTVTSHINENRKVGKHCFIGKRQYYRENRALTLRRRQRRSMLNKP